MTQAFVIYSLIAITFFIISGCVNDLRENSSNSGTNFTSTNLADTSYVKSWLEKVIISFVYGDSSKENNDSIEYSMSSDYHNYKLDAVTRDYSGITKEEFENKWNEKFDPKFVGNNGFFFRKPDHGKEILPSFLSFKSVNDSTILVKVKIEDIQKSDIYNCDVIIQKSNGRLKIMDIREYE